MADTHMSDQFLHMALVENITNKSSGFPAVQFLPVTGYNTGSVLTSVLQYQKTIVQQLVDVRALARYNPEDAAHDEACSVLSNTAFEPFTLERGVFVSPA